MWGECVSTRQARMDHRMYNLGLTLWDSTVLQGLGLVLWDSTVLLHRLALSELSELPCSEGCRMTQGVQLAKV